MEKERKPEWQHDYDLVCKATQGDIDAKTELYLSAFPSVYRYVRSKCLRFNPECGAPEDVVSEAFRKCYGKLDNFRGESLFSSWVCGFARYVMLGAYGKSVRRRRLSHFSSVELSAQDPADIIIKKERDMCLWIAFGTLSYLHRLLISCYVLEEMPPRKVIRMTKLRYNERHAELEAALRILKHRFSALYYNYY